MERLSDENTQDASEDYEVSYEEGRCVAVGWTSEERQELYGVEWEEPLHDDSFWSGFKSLFE